MKLLFSILCPKPELRASMEEIIVNEWINQPVDISEYKWEEVVRDTEFNGNNAGDSNRDEQLQKLYDPNVNKIKLDQSFEKSDQNEDKATKSKNNISTKTNLFEKKFAILSKSF